MATVADLGRPLPAVVLAAGRGDRFRAAGGTGPKVLAPLDGRPLVAHVVRTAAAAGLGPIVVVVGAELADGPTLTAALAGVPDVDVVVNARSSMGPGASLATGLVRLAEGPEPAPAACVVLLGDQPGIAPVVVADAVATWRRTGRPVRTRYLDGPGHPVVLPAATWPLLIERTAGGARDLLDDLAAEELAVDTPAPRDVDVPDDLIRR